MKNDKKQKGKRFNFSNLELTSLALPGILYFLVFCYLPMFGIVIAFKKYSYVKGIWGSDWIGFKNFRFFFTSQDAMRITRNTVLYNVVFIVLGIFCAVVVALLLYEIKERYLIKIYQTSIILPNFLSWVIVGYISYILLNPNYGVFNQVLRLLGKEGISWYSETVYWPFILTGFNIWKNVGMDSIIYYAALLGISKELYEAAEIDGANKWQKVKNVSVPHLVPTIIILAITKVGNIMRGDFGLFYQIPKDIGLLYPVTDVIDTYVFRGLRGGDMGTSSAVGLFQSVVGLILVVITNYIVNKIEPDNAMF